VRFNLFMFVTLCCMGISVLNAESYYQELAACNDGDPEACFRAGNFYSSDGYKLKDYNASTAAHEVAKLYKKSCDLGYIKGCTAFAMNYTAGKDLDKKHDARYYFNKACEGGDESACVIQKMMPTE